MKKNGRLVSIHGTDVMITGMDYDYLNTKENVAPRKFDITFDAVVNNQVFVICFSNARLSNQDYYLADHFIGTGEAYREFLKAIENKPPFKDANTYSEETEQAANAVIGEIAQSVYSHVQSHSPDQDEE